MSDPTPTPDPIPKKAPWWAQLDGRAVAAIILTLNVGLAIVMVGVVALIDITRPPSDSKLAEEALQLTSTVVTAGISLLGVWLGMQAATYVAPAIKEYRLGMNGKDTPTELKAPTE